MRVGLEEGVLEDVLGIFVVAGDVLGQAVDLPLIAIYQLREGVLIPALAWATSADSSNPAGALVVGVTGVWNLLFTISGDAGVC